MAQVVLDRVSKIYPGNVKAVDNVSLEIRDQEFVVTYSGTVESGSMSGTVKFGDSSSGKWTATRK